MELKRIGVCYTNPSQAPNFFGYVMFILPGRSFEIFSGETPASLLVFTIFILFYLIFCRKDTDDLFFLNDVFHCGMKEKKLHEVFLMIM